MPGLPGAGGGRRLPRRPGAGAGPWASGTTRCCPGGIIRLYSSLDEPERVTRALVEGGVAVQGVHSRGANLEDYFLSMIGGVRHG